MKWFPELRALGLLQRIAKALERANALKEKELTLAYTNWAKREGKSMRPARLMESGVASIEDWNKAHRAEHGLED